MTCGYEMGGIGKMNEESARESVFLVSLKCSIGIIVSPAKCQEFYSRTGATVNDTDTAHPCPKNIAVPLELLDIKPDCFVLLDRKEHLLYCRALAIGKLGKLLGNLVHASKLQSRKNLVDGHTTLFHLREINHLFPK
jgi:hypothetical protein